MRAELNKKKRIAVLLPLDPSKPESAPGVARLEMFTHLNDFEVECFHYGIRKWGEGCSIGSFYPEGNWKNVFSFLRLLLIFSKRQKEVGFDLIWVTCPPLTMAFFAIALKWIFKLPFIVDVRDPSVSNIVIAHSRRALIYKIAYRMEKFVYLQADLICAVTVELQQLLISRFSVPTSKLQVISNASTFKEEANIPLTKPIKVIYAGGFQAYHVVDKVIENLIINRSSSRFIFDFWGYQENKCPELEGTVKENKAESWIRLHPPVERSRIFDELRNSHVVLIPIFFSEHGEEIDYAIPLKFYDALAVSKPILLFGGTKASREELENNDIGVICGLNNNIFEKLDEIINSYPY